MLEKNFLDISIPELKHTLTNELKCKAFLTMPVTIEEKYDGTKLTLIRNSQDYSKDYKKNWIVAYKSFIIYPEEVENIDRSKIKKDSIGISQYAFVHDILKNSQDKLKDIPKNTEFFVEFIMDKPTITRNYNIKHNLVLLAYSKTTFSISNGRVSTVSPEYNTKNIEKFSNMLNIRLPNKLFKGKLIDMPKGAITHNVIKLFNDYRDAWENSSTYTEKEIIIRKIFTSFESSFGGKPEGAIIKDSEGNIIGKYVNEDQYDKTLRTEKKLKWKMDFDKEQTYKDKLKEIAKDIIKNSYFPKEFRKALSSLSDIVYSYNLDNVEHTKKDNFKKQEDLFLIAKNLIIKNAKGNNWCLFQGRFQPPTKAHIQIIKDCIDKYKFDGVYIVMVRGTKSDSFNNPFTDNLRKKIIDIQLKDYKGKYKISFTNSGLIPNIIGKLDKNINAIIGGSDRKNEYEKFSKELDVKFVEIKRPSDSISATKVRNSLINDDIKSFKDNMGFYDKNLYNEMKLQILSPAKESIENTKYNENKSVNNVLRITLTEYIGGI